jgi:hypothetical protein
VKVVYLYSGNDGQSHFADCEVTAVQSALGATSLPLQALEVSVRDTEGGPTSVDFRPAPRRQLVILLQGQVAYFCGDGSRRLLASGDILVADDTTGQGHRAEIIENPRVQVFVPLAPDADLTTWFAAPVSRQDHGQEVRRPG